jgi:hypothetical protein
VVIAGLFVSLTRRFEFLQVNAHNVFEVGDDDANDPAGLKDPHRLGHKRFPLVSIEMLKHVRMVDDVKTRLGERQPIAKIAGGDSGSLGRNVNIGPASVIASAAP